MILPQTSTLGVLRPKSSEDDLIWKEAVENTAEQLSKRWFNFIISQAPILERNSTSLYPRYATYPTKLWDLDQQKSEMAKARLDSSVLAPILPEPESDHPHAFPPLDFSVIDPHSEEYFNKLVSALDLPTYSLGLPACSLDLLAYSHVDQTIMQ